MTPCQLYCKDPEQVCLWSCESPVRASGGTEAIVSRHRNQAHVCFWFSVLLRLRAISHHMQVRRFQPGPYAWQHATHSPDDHIEAQATNTLYMRSRKHTQRVNIESRLYSPVPNAWQCLNSLFPFGWAINSKQLDSFD